MSESNNDNETLISHLEALRETLLRCLTAIAVVLPFTFFLAPKALNLFIDIIIGDSPVKLNYFSPMEVFIIQLKAGLIIAFVIAFPYIVYQVKNFVGPALYENEKKFLSWLVTLATLLFAAGSAFCLFIILPLIMNFSASFSSSQLEATLSIENFLNLAAAMMLAFGIMFQFPLGVLICVKFGLVSVETLKHARPYIIVLILILAAIFTPPDVVSQLMLGIPTWLLFEAGLAAAAVIEKS